MIFNKIKFKLIKLLGKFFGVDLFKLRWIVQGNLIRLLTKEFYLPIINVNMHPWGKIKNLKKIVLIEPFSKVSPAKLKTVASNEDIDIPQLNPLTIFVIEDINVATPIGGVIIERREDNINHSWYPKFYSVGISKFFFTGAYVGYDFHRNDFARGLYEFKNLNEIFNFIKIKKNKINQPCTVIPVIKNYSHWIISYLPKILKFYNSFKYSKIDELKNFEIKFFINKNASKFQIQSLEYFKIPIEFIEDFEIKTKTFFLLETGINDLMQVDDILFIANESVKKINYNPDISSDNSKNMILFREESARQPDFKDQLTSCFENFETIYPHKLNFENQFNKFNKTKCLISWHGAGLANIIWMKEKSKVVEIFPNGHSNHVFLTLCNIKNIDHLTIFENDLKFNFEATIKKIKNFLN
tara:strand:+ start:62 stop:1297 length:1236 start_codon:yes stop_codon:yes gene_type:complete